jgi:hypothetical protein
VAVSKSILIACAAGLLALAGCDRQNTGGPGYPSADFYEVGPTFAGEWIGEVGQLPGELSLGELSPGNYFGRFKADAEKTEYALLLEQTMIEAPGGGLVPSNRLTFTWQDGLGGRGHGWLLINREDTALTGSFGYAQATDGLGGWTFIRFDDAQ